MVIISLYLNPIMCNFILFICNKGFICILAVTLVLRVIGVCAVGFLGCNVISRVIYGILGLDL